MYYDVTVTQFSKMLGNLSAFLDKGAKYGEGKKVEFGTFLQTRLAPDQFPLVRQIQMACDTAKLGVARLTGKDAPSHADNEASLAEVKSRIESVISYLKSFQESDFSAATDRRISQPRWEGKWITGQEYFHQHLVPNFYFHITTAYAILRNNGVDVGKRDFLGPIPLKA